MMIKLYVELLYNTRLFCRGLLVNFLALNIYNFILSIIPRKMEDKELQSNTSEKNLFKTILAS